MLRYNLYLVALATAFQLTLILVADALVNVGALPGVDGAVTGKRNPVEAEDFAEQPALLHASSL